MALNIGNGDEVITIPYTWISTAEMIAMSGATPVFVDVLPDSFNLDPSRLDSAINDRTKAIMPVGIYGQPADITSIKMIAEEHGIPVIEDAAQCSAQRTKATNRADCLLSVALRSSHRNT